jgi:hypothetical protein
LALLFLLPFVSASGQDSTPVCPGLSIKTAERTDSGSSIWFSAEVPPKSPIKTDWIFMKQNTQSGQTEYERFQQKESVRISVWATNDPGVITAVAITKLAANCESIDVASVSVLPRVGYPLIIDEYGNVDWNEERARLDTAIASMQERPEHELLIFLYLRATDSGLVRRTRMIKILGHMKVRNFDPKRITFVISTDGPPRVRLRAASRIETEVISEDPEYLAIPAERISQYRQLFK